MMGSAMTLASLFAPTEEVPLPAAPLELVVAQVRFPPIMSIASESGFIGPFQEALRREYPVLRPSLETRVVLTPDGKALPQEGQRVWRFEQKDGPWQLALTADFIAVSTNTYTNRGDFIARVGAVLEALDRSFAPGRFERVGVRYVSRVVEPELLQQLPRLFRPEVLGLAGVPVEPGEARLRHSLTDSLITLNEVVNVRARWGMMPPHTTFDAALPPSEAAGFILDLDVYSDTPDDYSAIRLRDMTASFCELQYSLFRWAVTPDFLRAYGGDV